MQSTADLAAKIGVSEQYIRRMIHTGKINAERVGKKQWVITDEEAARFITEREKKRAQRRSS